MMHKDVTLCQRLTMQGVRHEAEFKLPCDSPVYHCSHLQVHSQLMSVMLCHIYAETCMRHMQHGASLLVGIAFGPRRNFCCRWKTITSPPACHKR